MFNSSVDWAYQTEKSEIASKSLKNGVFWPRGKMLGGSGSINAMLYIRGNSRDYDEWEKMGNPGWGWDSVLEYFKKSEDVRFDEFATKANGKYHAKGGPLKVEPFFSYDPLKDMMLEAAQELGYKMNEDVNAEEFMGYNTCLGTIENGRRVSPAKAFLSPIKDRKNLHVVKHAQVANIIINKDGKAEGVHFIIQGTKVMATAKKEVILSAGAINSPQILMLSGVGPKAHLKKFSIKCKKDLPVGKNLQDHAIVYVPFKFHKSQAQPIAADELYDEIYMYLRHKVGKFSHHGTTDLVGFINTVNKTAQFPDIQFHHFQFRRGEENKLEKFADQIGYTDEVKKSLMDVLDDSELVMVMVTLLKPKSFGKIELNSAYPLDKPLIYGNYLLEQEDVDTLVRGIDALMPFLGTKTFKEHEGKLHKLNITGCDEHKYHSNAYWKCFVRHTTTTVYHPTSTCKMGPDTDPEAVVDSRLRVKGIKGLRVIDASIMPLIVSGNTNAPTIMIGEKGADFIKKDWQEKDSKSHSEL